MQEREGVKNEEKGGDASGLGPAEEEEWKKEKK